MLVQTKEFGKINLCKPRRAFDLKQILVVIEYRIAAHVCRACIEHGRVRLGVDNDELVMHDHRRERWRVLAGEDVDFRLKSGRRERGAEEFGTDGVLIVARSMKKLEGRELVGRDVSGSGRWARHKQE